MEIIGWIGNILFASCGIPQSWKCFKTKSAKDFSWMFLGMWGSGEILTFIYVFPKLLYPLLFNYVISMITVSIILYYKIKGGIK